MKNFFFLISSKIKIKLPILITILIVISIGALLAFFMGSDFQGEFFGSLFGFILSFLFSLSQIYDQSDKVKREHKALMKRDEKLRKDHYLADSKYNVSINANKINICTKKANTWIIGLGDINFDPNNGKIYFLEEPDPLGGYIYKNVRIIRLLCSDIEKYSWESLTEIDVYKFKEIKKFREDFSSFLGISIEIVLDINDMSKQADKLKKCSDNKEKKKIINSYKKSSDDIVKKFKKLGDCSREIVKEIGNE